MADLSDLASQYTRFSKLVPVNRSNEIKAYNEYRMFGTIENNHPNENIHDVGAGTRGSFLWRGKIKFDYIMNESRERVHFSAKFSGEEGLKKYNTLNEFLNGVTEDGVTQGGVTEEDIIEVVMKRTRSTEDNMLYMIFCIGRYFIRGSGRTDFLQGIGGKTALDFGIINPPEDDENV